LEKILDCKSKVINAVCSKYLLFLSTA